MTEKEYVNQEYIYEDTKYKETCSCGKTHEVYTQDDKSPEYYIKINIVCECGQIVPFILPVN